MLKAPTMFAEKKIRIQLTILVFSICMHSLNFKIFLIYLFHILGSSYKNYIFFEKSTD